MQKIHNKSFHLTFSRQVYMVADYTNNPSCFASFWWS